MNPRAKNSQRGAAALEFVLVAPVAIFLIGAILTLGLHGYVSASINSAARDGVRYASTRESNRDPYPTDAEVAAYIVNEKIPGFLPAPDVTVTSTGSGAGSSVTVTVAYEDLPLLSAAGILLRALGATGVDDITKSASGRRE